MFKLHGLGGYFILVAVLLLLLYWLGSKALEVQQDNAVNYYELDRYGKPSASDIPALLPPQKSLPDTQKSDVMVAVAETPKPSTEPVPAEQPILATESTATTVPIVASAQEVTTPTKDSASAVVAAPHPKYALCVACHGAQGEGNKALNAPRLAGQMEWYLTRQVINFKSGIRGTHPEDSFGAQMRPMAMGLADDKEIEDLSNYIASMSGDIQPSTLSGDPAAGKTKYALCLACHGANGEGNKALNAPKLAGQADWYLVRQLKNYKSGIRGTHAEDTFGAQMRPMAATLSESDMTNIAVYLNDLK